MNVADHKPEERAVPHPSKIATCCYCGARAALVLSGDSRHELACSSCGAPLHNLKQMPVPARGKEPAHFSHPIRTPKSKGKAGYKTEKRAAHPRNNWHDTPFSKKKKPKKRRGKWAKDLFEDVFDVIEDIFD